MAKPPSKQIPIVTVFLAFLIFALNTSRALAFSNNRYLAYGNKKALVVSLTKPQVLGSYTVSDAYITSLVTDMVNKMVSQGLLKGEKGDKGDTSSFPTLASVDPNSSDFQQVYIPGAVSAANQQTFLAATNLSGDNITVNSVNTGDLDSTGAFTNEGSASFSGNANFTASTTMANLNVATIESPVSIANFDGYSWTNASSKELKENFATITPDNILTKIDSLPIYTWNYKTENSDIVHIGPVAEDFYTAFGLGNSSSSISTIDPAGVALAGIQGLDAKISAMLDISWILDGLKSLGVSIAQGFIKVESLIADMVQTKQLEVGSLDQPAGITIYDTVTKLPVCIFSANNVLQSQPGKCPDVMAVSQRQPATVPAQTPQTNNSTTTVEDLPAASDVSSSTPPAVDPTTMPPALITITPDTSSSASSTLNNLTINN
ncbi:MAG: tail fiber domain-containing protein [Candidatus Doudnabacteria bacterium]|nr:tail fiber domain-containing protein [Candidatus Doudnabacteria bacterium]